MRGRPAPPQTVREHLAWAYANLARADAAVRGGAARYGTVHHVIRAKLYKGLTTGTMSLGSLLDDERWKLMGERACAYCGSTEALSLDHLLPRARGVGDRPENIVLACRSCNSAKRDRDMVEWFVARGGFPPLMLLRRYLKLTFAISEENGWLDLPLADLARQGAPFDGGNFPLHFPDLRELKH